MGIDRRAKAELLDVLTCRVKGCLFVKDWKQVSEPLILTRREKEYYGAETRRSLRNGSTRAWIMLLVLYKSPRGGKQETENRTPSTPAREHLDHSTLLLPTVDGASSQSKELLQGSGKNVDPIVGLPRSEPPLGVMLSLQDPWSHDTFAYMQHLF